jgi:alkyl hydroperoxide reductase subunit AhpC
VARYTVLFFYPLDWTFVCPTEIVAFSDAMPKFKEIGCEVPSCPPSLPLLLKQR